MAKEASRDDQDSAGARKSDQTDSSGNSSGYLNWLLYSIGGGTASQWIFSMFGFSSSGIVKGSAAAAIQSGIGNVGSGSAFATFQSIGMTFYGILSAPFLLGSILFGGGYMIWKAILSYFYDGMSESKGEDKKSASSSGEITNAGKIATLVLVGGIITGGCLLILKK